MDSDRDHSSFVRQDPGLLLLSTTCINTDLIVALFAVPPDIFTEPALPTDGHTNKLFWSSL